MLMSRTDCLNRYGSDYRIAKQIEGEHLFQLEKGVFSDKPYAPEEAILAFKYPNAIMTMQSAFYQYGLTDVIPDKYFLATDRNAAKIKDERVHQVFMPSNTIEIGAETMDIHDFPIRIYNQERLLIELLRNKSSLPYDFYKEVLLSYRRILPQLDIQKIQDYAANSPKSNLIMNILRTEVF